MAFPAFYGVAGELTAPHGQVAPLGDSLWRRVWNLSRPKLALWIRIGEGAANCSYAEGIGMEPSVFVWGHPLVASDTEFDTHTQIERIPEKDVARKIGHLYRKLGTQCLELLEGNFCCVIVSSESREIALVADKFGCDDIYLRVARGSVAFASHPALLPGPLRLDAKAAAFFLAQEGFVPAPFTLFGDVETVGRAKLVRIKANGHTLSIERNRYWSLAAATENVSLGAAAKTFHRLLDNAVESRRRTRNAILLSGGADSSLLANLLNRRQDGGVFAITGAVWGNGESELDVTRAAALSTALGIAHEPVYLDAGDDTLPDEWAACAASWSGGTRITFPLFYRLAKRVSERSGENAGVFSGQMADTLADNNYTLPSPGYMVRRLFFSPWFLKVLCFAGVTSPEKDSRIGRLLAQVVKRCTGARFAAMAASVLDGFRSRDRFYAGRVFGFGEMPGCSPAGFPVLSDEGFEKIAGWYSSNFVAPVVSQLMPETFYRDMMELSMDMVMLHLDTRLVVHALRLGGGYAELPFLDSRLVKFFASLPYKARAFYRRPKWVIRTQFEKQGYVRHGSRLPFQQSASIGSASFEELLLAGSIGSYFREVLSRQSIFDEARGLIEFINEDYVESQLRAFQQNRPGVNCKFIARMAALQLWSQASTCDTAHASRAAAIA